MYKKIYTRAPKMENFNMGDFTMDFEFDFQNDFTATENQVIDDILTNETETDGIFDGTRENPSSTFFEYFGDDSGAVNGLGISEQYPQQQYQMAAIESGMNQAGFNNVNFSTPACEIAASVDEQNVDGIDFDWTTFLQDKTPGQLKPSDCEQSTDTNDEQQQQQNSASADSSNSLLGSVDVINDNGFVYQELKTLDVPQIYCNLDKAFGLDDLKKLDKCVDFASLSTTKHTTQQENNNHDNDAEDDGGGDEPIIGHRNDGLARKKVFLMPLQMDEQSTESLKNVAAKLKKNPMVLNSLLSKCGKTKKAEKFQLTADPKRSLQQSEQYLSVRERLERVAAKNIALPMIKTGSTERRQRKQIIKMENDKVPIQYAVKIILNDINKSGIFKINTNISSSSSTKETVTEKPKKVKKQSPKSKPTSKHHEPIEAAAKVEPKNTRRSSKKIKIQ